MNICVLPFVLLLSLAILFLVSLQDREQTLHQGQTKRALLSLETFEELLTTLPLTSRGKLFHLIKAGSSRTNNQPLVVARSYDGHPWEVLPDKHFSPIQLECNGLSCAVLTPGNYEVREVPVPTESSNPSSSQLASRFLSQTTFGVKKSELDHSTTTYQTDSGLDYARWIRDQMKSTPTLLRSYYRHRSNPRQLNNSFAATVFRPCEIGSRWHRFAFTIRDRQLTLEIRHDAVNRFTLLINGERRTEIQNFTVSTTFPAFYTICDVQERVGGTFRLTPLSTTTCNVLLSNPAIFFSQIDSSTTISVAQSVQFEPLGKPDNFIMKENSIGCPFTPTNPFIEQNGFFYRFDPRIKLLKNTLTSPVNTDLHPTAPIVAKTFLNEKSCVRHSSFGQVQFSSTMFNLSETILRAWYTEDQIYVYYVTGLRLEENYAESPCASEVSRWLRLGSSPCVNLTAGIDPTTLETIVSHLANSSRANPFIRDIRLSASPNCSRTAATIGARVQVNGECFQHVHPHLYDVRNFIFWSENHDGNPVALAGGRPNPIKRWAEQGLPYLEYPWHHDMGRWRTKQIFIPTIGKLGDQIDFLSLPTELQTVKMAALVGAITQLDNFETCGSPGEAENSPIAGHHYHMLEPTQSIAREELDFPYSSLSHGKSVLWTNVALKSHDQLRQRVAWALSQIIVISDAGLEGGDEMEDWATFYDIFVRNSFGNYRDILREISLNPMMSDYLSYRRNRAYARSNTYPDENFAREIMQLFSIGLYKLNDDGSEVLDSDGNPIPTYSNDNIVDFARVWTGFDLQSPRGNIEQKSGSREPNYVDPLRLRASSKDLLPKAKLDGGYLGDRYPICESLPPQHWLKEGAHYILSGTSSIEGPTIDSGAGEIGPMGRLELRPVGSFLYSKLCAPDFLSGKCTFPSEVILDSNLECYGYECNASRVVAVKVVDQLTMTVMYYTYVPTCVGLTFFDRGQRVGRSSLRQCADPRSSVALPVCCSTLTTNSASDHNYDKRQCLFANEATTYQEAVRRCASRGLFVCSRNFTQSTNYRRTCAREQYVWLNGTCTLKVQVYSSGQIGVVDPLVTSNDFSVLLPSSNNVFRVEWNSGKFPTTATQCGGDASCRVVGSTTGDTCLCDIHVTHRPFFTDMNLVPTREKILSSLFVGAPKPSSYGPSYYSLCTTISCVTQEGVRLWLKFGVLDENAIFEVTPVNTDEPRIYLANLDSTVFIGNVPSPDSPSFRNPPHVMPLAGEQIHSGTDSLWFHHAKRELEAFLDHLFHHQNTAPFVAYRLIQRLVTSNPSPRFIRSVSEAFRTGTYNGEKFSGKYGDLAATVMAILMDREARSSTVEVSPTFGSLREPILKVLGFLRAMNYQSVNQREIMLIDMDAKIGMEVFNAPTVFGFYLPEFSPSGAISDLGCVSPEAQLGSSPFIIGFLNGMVSLIDRGLTSCSNGFGQSCSGTLNDGTLSYVQPPNLDEIISEMDLLLTHGRLNSFSRNFLKKVYNDTLRTSDSSHALRTLQKLFIATPEFHTTSANVLSSNLRKSASPQSNNTSNTTNNTTNNNTTTPRPYKAIIVIFQNGGCDSFSVLVPYSNCSAKDLYAEYSHVRQGAAISRTNLLPISVPPGTQPCDVFSVNNNLPTVKTLYDQNDALFISNIGALIEPITKEDYLGKSSPPKKLPRSLFAHNVMTQHMQTLHPQNIAAVGVLGRAINSLLSLPTPYRSDLYSLVGAVKILEGTKEPDYIDPTNGVTRFRQFAQLGELYNNLTQFHSESVFSETYAHLLRQSLERTEAIGAQFSTTQLSTTFLTDSFNRQLQQVSRLIKMRNTLNSERGVFFVQQGGFDSHGTFNISGQLGPINSGLNNFVNEMKAQGIWDSVAVVTVSEFARTLTSNGAGTDHAWGGNHFLAGGKVRGGKILGNFPDTLTDAGSLNIGRGRIIPTTSWEALWKGLVEWFGVPDDQLNYVLPNLANFPAHQIFNASTLFEP